MPFHDWTDRPGWDGMHLLWISELLRWVKPRLPEGYRAYVGTAPLLAVGAPPERPDLGVRSWGAVEDVRPPEASGEAASSEGPDVEVAVAAIDPGTSLMIERRGRLVAAVELISPRNKDRPTARASYLARDLGYLLGGAHLVVIDVHARPVGFSFADAIAAEFSMTQPPCPAPAAVSYRVGEPAAEGGRFLAIWRRPLVVGAPLPTIPLPLAIEAAISIDLEMTYSRAAADAYLD